MRTQSDSACGSKDCCQCFHACLLKCFEAVLAFSGKAMVSWHLLFVGASWCMAYIYICIYERTYMYVRVCVSAEISQYPCCSCQAQFHTDGAVVNGVSHDDLYALWCRIAALTCLGLGLIHQVGSLD